MVGQITEAVLNHMYSYRPKLPGVPHSDIGSAKVFFDRHFSPIGNTK